MAVNQSQVDHIIASASSDDPEVKLLKLQDEVELIKTSIKRLLIDIRERMNDLENPIVMSGGRVPGEDVSSSMAHVMRDTSSAIESAASAIKSTTEMKKAEEQAHGASTQPPSPAQYAPQPATHQAPEITQGFPPQIPAPAMQGGQSELDLFAALRSQLATLPKEDEVAKAAIGDKVRLQKVFRLFEWTSRNVKRFGHDRVDLMLEAYHAMGYISDQSCKLVKDMTRLMPTSIGEIHEIKADEFVSELYELNHILNPSDSTLDRDMIEVLMEKREGKEGQKLLSPARTQEGESGSREYLPSRDRI
jgi:hypothetical protein